MVDARFLSSTDTEAKLPLLSIIVTSYTTKRLNDVLELLDSIKAQTYPNIETVFVAERSKELGERVRAYAQEKTIPNLIVVFNEGEPGASAARNLGIKEAKGEIIAFVDDDAVLFPDWAEEMIKTYENESIIGVTGPAYPLWEHSPARWLPEEFHWIIGCTTWLDCKEVIEVRNVWLQNASFRQEAFELAGFLDPDLGPRDSTQGFKGREFKEGIISEEVEFSLRVKRITGRRIVLNPGVKVKHKVDNKRLKLSYITRWAYWMGFSKHKIKKLYSQTHTDPLSHEYQLLKRIITRLLPTILKGLVNRPVIACHRLLVTIIVLFFVALGYYSHFFSSVRWHRKFQFGRSKTKYDTRV